ncbi:MAG TPA: DUF4440 domain-containing protein [Candidatus Angelobacter sp.]
MILFRVLILSLAMFVAAPNQQSSSVEDGIAKIRLDWARDLHEKRLEEIAMLYAPDAVFISPDVGRVTGRAAIRELCKNVMQMFTSDLTFHSIKTENSGSLAYDSGDFRETLTKLADGTKSDDQGSYLMVFKRQADGNWLIAQQMWSPSPPPHK